MQLEPPHIPPEKRRHLRRTEYERLVASGAFDHERLELLFGMLVRMSPQGAAHFEAVSRLYSRLHLALHARADVRSQGPLALGEDSEPEPDVMVVPLGDYAATLPETAYLVVEVADSSLKDDRDVKRPLYAAANIPEYWIVNLRERVFEVHRDPQANGYRSVTRHGRGEMVALLAFPEVSVAVGDIIPA